MQGGSQEPVSPRILGPALKSCMYKKHETGPNVVLSYLQNICNHNSKQKESINLREIKDGKGEVGGKRQ